MPKYDILRYRQGRNEHEVLVYHTNFEPYGIARPGYMRELLVDVYLATVRVNQTV